MNENDDLEYWREAIRELQIERDRITYNTRINHAWREGFLKGYKELYIKRRKMELKRDIKIIVSRIYDIDNIDWIDNYTYEQLHEVLNILFENITFNDWLDKLRELKKKTRENDFIEEGQ